MNNQTTFDRNTLIQQLHSNPELLKQNPELFQRAVIEFLASLDNRLSKIEERWMTPLI
jgi:hypothetical protein